jgi:hypothetical protein
MILTDYETFIMYKIIELFNMDLLSKKRIHKL